MGQRVHQMILTTNGAEDRQSKTTEQAARSLA